MLLFCKIPEITEFSYNLIQKNSTPKYTDFFFLGGGLAFAIAQFPDTVC